MTPKPLRLIVPLLLLALTVLACNFGLGGADSPAPTDGPDVAATVEVDATEAPEPTGAPEPTEGAAVDAEAFADELTLALEDGDFETLESLMGEAFIFGFWQSEGYEVDPSEAVAELEANLITESSAVFVDPEQDVAEVLGSDPSEAFGPDVNVAQTLYVTGMGPDADIDGIVFIVEDENGAPYWHGLLLAPGGFTDPGGPVAGDGASADAPIPSTVIIADYEADQAAADAMYKDQSLFIIGTITNINDVFGVKALLLRDSEEAVGLQCYLTDAADADLVTEGDTVIVEGTIQGGELGFFMVAEPCALVEVVEPQG